MTTRRAERIALLRKQISKWESVDIDAMRAELAELESELQRARFPVCVDCGQSWQRDDLRGPTPSRCRECTAIYDANRRWRPYSEIKAAMTTEAIERHRVANRERMRKKRQSDPELREREAARKRAVRS